MVQSSGNQGYKYTQPVNHKNTCRTSDVDAGFWPRQSHPLVVMIAFETLGGAPGQWTSRHMVVDKSGYHRLSRAHVEVVFVEPSFIT